MKASNLSYGFRGSLVLNRFDLSGIYFNPLGRHNIAKEDEIVS